METKELTIKHQFNYAMIGVAIGLVYVGIFLVVTNPDWENLESVTDPSLVLPEKEVVKEEQVVTQEIEVIEEPPEPINFDDEIKERMVEDNDLPEGKVRLKNGTVIDWIFDFILPMAYGQILPFEQQLEQIRDPKECTRKVVQGASAEIPFTLKVVYDTSKDVKLEFKQQGTSFPVVQRTNQVMTFFSDGADQYEIYVEVNYNEPKPRQMYIEYLASGAIVQSEQEKFEGVRFCMTIFVNTVVPTPQPTKEEIFGESLTYIKQIPAMVIAFNANSQTSATSISWVWILLLAVVILSILTYLNSITGKRRFDSRMKDLDDSIVQVNEMTTTMDDLVTSVKEPFDEIIKNLRIVLNLPQIKEKLPKEKKESGFKKLIPFRKKVIKQTMETVKKIDEHKTFDKATTDDKTRKYTEEEPIPEEKPKSTKEEVLEALQSTPEEIEAEKKIPEPSGGYVILDSEEEPEPELEKVPPQTPPPKDENNPMNLQPVVFNEIMKDIDFEKHELREGMLKKYTYTELNECFGWIDNYRNWIEGKKIEVPKKFQEKQKIAEEVIYNAIFKKIDERNKI